MNLNARAEREIGWEEEVMEGGDSWRSGINGECEAPERSPAIQMDEMGEPDGVLLLLWGCEGDKATRKLLWIWDYYFRRIIFIYISINFLFHSLLILHKLVYSYSFTFICLIVTFSSIS